MLMKSMKSNIITVNININVCIYIFVFLYICAFYAVEVRRIKMIIHQEEYERMLLKEEEDKILKEDNDKLLEDKKKNNKIRNRQIFQKLEDKRIREERIKQDQEDKNILNEEIRLMTNNIIQENDNIEEIKRNFKEVNANRQFHEEEYINKKKEEYEFTTNKIIFNFGACIIVFTYFIMSLDNRVN